MDSTSSFLQAPQCLTLEKNQTQKTKKREHSWNDDDLRTANIRELYKPMKPFGHNVYIVASVTNQSGTGGTSIYTKDSNLTADGEFGMSRLLFSSLCH